MNKTLYKSLPKDMSPHGHKFKVGKWYKIDGKLEICKRGFHASKRAINAMYYVDCEVLAKVEVKGKSEKESDKECWEEMKIIKTYKWTKKDSISLAIYSAELVLNNFEKKFPNDNRPRLAIEAAKAMLKNNTKKNRDTAKSAECAAWYAAQSTQSARSAWSALFAKYTTQSALSALSARSAALSAKHATQSALSALSAAESAAWYAAQSAKCALSAAESAAWYAGHAAESTRYAAQSAEYKKTLNKIEKWIHNRIGF